MRLPGVVGSICVRRHRIVGTALREHQVSRHLARYKENANLLPHIDVMNRAAKAAKRRTPSTLVGTASQRGETPA